MKGMRYSEMATLSHCHCLFLLVLGLVLVPDSSVHFSTQFYTQQVHLSLCPSFSSQSFTEIMLVVYIHYSFNSQLEVLNY